MTSEKPKKKPGPKGRPRSPQVPPIITPNLISQACGVTARVALGWLLAEGIAKQFPSRTKVGSKKKEKGGRWYVGERALQERLSDVYDRVYAYVVLGQRPE